MPVLDSASIKVVDYDPIARDLDVIFTTGRRYTYFDVPQSEYDALMEAPSAGEYFNTHIRGEYEFREHKQTPQRK
jgi:lysyl-tRNA synthetase class 2